MASEIIQSGNKIEMRALSKVSLAENINEPECYVSQFYKWTERNSALITAPVYQNQPVQLIKNGIYELRFFTSSGLYRCKVVAVGKIKESSSSTTSYVEVKFISAMEKYQRRQYYRMDCVIHMKYAILSDVQREMYKNKKRFISLEQKMLIDQKLEKQELEFRDGLVLDISGGGMRFNSSVQQQKGDILLLQPKLPEKLEKRIPYLYGRVVYSRKIQGKSPVTYDNRVEFIELSHLEQEELITYIFKEERDKRKRESDLV